MSGGKRKLGAKPELVILGDSVGFVIEDSEISIRCSLSNQNPHPLDRDILVRVVHTDAKDQLGEVADLQAFPPISIWNPESAGRFRMARFAIFKAPSVALEIRLAHQTMVSGKDEGRKVP